MATDAKILFCRRDFFFTHFFLADSKCNPNAAGEPEGNGKASIHMQQRPVDEEQVEDPHEAAKPTPAPCLVAAGLRTTSKSTTKTNSSTTKSAKTSDEHKLEHHQQQVRDEDKLEHEGEAAESGTEVTARGSKSSTTKNCTVGRRSVASGLPMEAGISRQEASAQWPAAHAPPRPTSATRLGKQVHEKGRLAPTSHARGAQQPNMDITSLSKSG